MIQLLLISLSYAQPLLNITRIPSTYTPPSARLYHFMEYNSNSNSLVIFGGSQDINTIYNDVWTYDLSTHLFSLLVPTTVLSPGIPYSASRMNSGGFYNSSSNKFCVFGGSTSNGPQNDLWCFDMTGLQWLKESPTGEIPDSRYRFGYTKYTDSTGLKFIVFGGSLAAGESNDTFM